MKRLLVVGAGGHAAACLDIIDRAREFAVKGLIDPAFVPGTERFGHLVLGGDDVLGEFRRDCDSAFVAIGQIKTTVDRRRVAGQLNALDFDFPVIKAPSAQVSVRTSIDKGGIIMNGAIIGPDVEVGAMSIINNQALIDHGTRLGNFVHVSTGSIVNGDCVVGDDCFLGSGSVIVQGVKIGSRCIVAAGAVVRHDLAADSVFRG